MNKRKKEMYKLQKQDVLKSKKHIILCFLSSF